MGKQVNYIMNYESFLQLAQYALEIGCLIICNNHTKEPSYPCADISAVVPEYHNYCFYLPELYPVEKITHGRDCYGAYYLSYYGTEFSLSIIEAGFSRNETDQTRIYVTTGMYDENKNWIPRPELLTKTYDKIAQKARKLAQQII